MMPLLFWLFGVSVVLDALLFGVPVVWRARRGLALAGLLTVTFAAGAVLMWRPTVFSGLLALAGLFRAFNYIRVVEGRMHERYLHRATRRTAVFLVIFQAAAVLAWLAWERWHGAGQVAWTVAAALQLAVAAVLLSTTIRRLQRTAWPARAKHYSDAELPTVTVAIPARNETEDLEGCLRSVLASDYPKLEVVVLDDCSQNRRTPEIIRSFAHAGVRFVQGEPPRETWLPKNEAYDRLADEASGEYILFCGVDVRFSPVALRHIISTMLLRRKRMMSILPQRALQARTRLALAQAMRYAWELVPPRRLFRRPPVLSSCWVIRRSALEDAGGFAAVARSIVPEAHFARQLTATDEYSFMRAGRNPGLQSVKNAGDQQATAIRMRYPQLHRRPENVLVLSLAEALCLLGPFALAVAGTWLGAGWPAVVMAVAAAVTLTSVYQLVGRSTKVSSGWLGLVAAPAAVAYDMALLYASMWRYEFAEVTWKGRNICVPAMHVIPRLPKI